MVSSLLVLRTVVIVFTATCRLSLLSQQAGAATLLQVVLTPMMIMTLLLVYHKIDGNRPFIRMPRNMSLSITANVGLKKL